MRHMKVAKSRRHGQALIFLSKITSDSHSLLQIEKDIQNEKCIFYFFLGYIEPACYFSRHQMIIFPRRSPAGWTTLYPRRSLWNLGRVSCRWSKTKDHGPVVVIAENADHKEKNRRPNISSNI